MCFLVGWSAMPATDKPLAVQELTVKLGGTPIVSHVDLTLNRGELALLTGANGAGKSTLLRALVNLLPSNGEIFIDGLRPTSNDARSRFVFVPDEAALYEDLTLAEHMRFQSLIYAQPQAEERMSHWLDRFGLTTRTGEYPSTHSRGMRQKLALSLALGLDTPLLLLDEPYNGLDLESQSLLNEALQERCRHGGTVLLTGHQSELLDNLGARHLKLVDGQLHT